MYAYIPEIERGFFEGVHALNDQARISSDPPSPAIRGLPETSLLPCSNVYVVGAVLLKTQATIDAQALCR
jgi:hypothetical protein